MTLVLRLLATASNRFDSSGPAAPVDFDRSRRAGEARLLRAPRQGVLATAQMLPETKRYYAAVEGPEASHPIGRSSRLEMRLLRSHGMMAGHPVRRMSRNVYGRHRAGPPPAYFRNAAGPAYLPYAAC